MFQALFQLGLVNAMLFLLYAAYPAWCLRSTGQALDLRLFYGMATAVALQALLGKFWDASFGAHPQAEALLFIGLLPVVIRFTVSPWLSQQPKALPGGNVLWAVLAAGFLVRCIHPLDVSYLGQSDAYIHLGFIKDIAEQGHIRHPGYPPGYHWVMALPSLIGGVDPYWMARFGGAFWGVMLCLGTFQMARAFFPRSSGAGSGALIATLCVAVFPAFNILIKTGVGVFANQAGLALFPVLLVLLVHVLRGPAPGPVAMLVVLSCGLAVSVPLMLLQFSMIAGMAVLAGILVRLFPVKSLLVRLAVPLAASLLVAVAHFAGAGRKHHEAVTRSMVGENPALQKTTGAQGMDHVSSEAVELKTEANLREPAVSGIAHLTADFLSFKRTGLNSTGMNVVILLLACFFFTLGVLGLKNLRPELLVPGVFGLLAALQTATGLFEFSMYQRAGWHLMLGAGLAGGWLWALLVSRLPPLCSGNRANFVLAGLAFVPGVVFFPAHHHALSSAEGAMVDVTRQLASQVDMHSVSLPNPADGPLTALKPGLPTTLLIRSVSGSNGGYWDLPTAVLPPWSGLVIRYPTGRKRVFQGLEEGEQYVVFLDQPVKLQPTDLGAVAAVDAAQARDYAQWQFKKYAANEVLREKLAGVPASEWTIVTNVIPPKAEVLVVFPTITQHGQKTENR